MGLDIAFVVPGTEGGVWYELPGAIELPVRHPSLRAIDNMSHYNIRSMVGRSYHDLRVHMINHISNMLQIPNLNSDMDIMISFLADLVHYEIPTDFIMVSY
jgi:hypothetical protein